MYFVNISQILLGYLKTMNDISCLCSPDEYLFGQILPGIFVGQILPGIFVGQILLGKFVGQIFPGIFVGQI